MNNPNFILSIILSIAIIFGWQYFYEGPKHREREKQMQALNKQRNEDNSASQLLTPKQEDIILTAQESIEQTQLYRVIIENKHIKGSINLQGARIDDLKLLDYKETIDGSNDVRLLSPGNTAHSYFTEIGWYSSKNNTKLPNSETIWTADKHELKPNDSVVLSWVNEDNVEFIMSFSLDENYMFEIKQSINNKSDKVLDVKPYMLINRKHGKDSENSTILHTGPIAVIDSKLNEYSYKNIKEDHKKQLRGDVTDWFGISDKYWLAAFIPDVKLNYFTNMTYTRQNAVDKYQVDSLAYNQEIAPDSNITLKHRLFLGAKKVKLLDYYSDKYGIALFDRAIDFGWLYFLTKPLFFVLSFFYALVGNFGISIMIITVIIKLLMLGLSTKSYKSIKKLRELQPQIDRIKDQYANDKMQLNQAIMMLYKKEKVNPLSGCLPLFVQIPVFFALYKVLYVTIEMRHAPFFGWIHDLSAPDPTSVINLFGLLPFTPPTFLDIGVLPIFMSLSMYVQQSMSQNPSMDPVQAQMLKFLPLMFLFMFSGFPAGLLIYWTWSNILSIAQQWYVNKRFY